ncbi:ribose transport system substrate-binding protein [Kineothrix alysoides]|uniref:Ribose transport system substrate-binding protein n=1 Tax=Kineothrix alysoides TaxID=1469948 RepID=A0A4R1QXT4_9FIRM|nr:sugar ABC transporter substrate-binding protein [Kineothrix alysoides]TCL56260.1 ribose transport system substrate-binding protein [Kineothrix alysoides]
MKKKILAALLTTTLAVTALAGCGQSATAEVPAAETTQAPAQEEAQAAAEETAADAAAESGAVALAGMTIGYCMPDTSESFLSWLSNSVKDLAAADGVTVDIADAAGSATTQISQIENFAASGTDLIIVMAVEPTGVTDAIERAQAAGSMVMVAGGDTGAYDAIMFTDQYEDGTMMAEMGAAWVEATFPDAEPGSIEIALLEDRSTPEANSRCDGMNTITDICDKVTIVQTVGSIKTNDAAQAAMENIMQTNPEIKLVLSYNSGGAMGVNEFATRAGSPVKDASQFAVFASDLDEASIAAIAQSGDNSSVFRGLIKFGSDDLPGDTYNLAKKILLNETYEVENPDPLTKITIDNVADYQ